MLYGTTYLGGVDGYGTVFKVGTSGKEQVLYYFTAVAPDGANPRASLVALNGVLYSTTQYGGNGSGGYGDGTVFKVSTSGK